MFSWLTEKGRSDLGRGRSPSGDPNLVVPSYDQIYKTLFIGNQACAEQLGHEFDLVVNCTNHIKNVYEAKGGTGPSSLRTRYIRVPVNDPGVAAPADALDIRVMRRAITLVVPAIDDYIRRGKRVLVHCHAGMQRSAAMCLAYVMHRTGCDVDTGIAYVVSRRPVAFMGGRQVNFRNAFP